MVRLTNYCWVIALVIGATALVPSVATSATSRGHRKGGVHKSHARSEATRHRAIKQRKASGWRDSELRQIERRWDDEQIEPQLPESE